MVIPVPMGFPSSSSIANQFCHHRNGLLGGDQPEKSRLNSTLLLQESLVDLKSVRMPSRTLSIKRTAVWLSVSSLLLLPRHRSSLGADAFAPPTAFRLPRSLSQPISPTARLVSTTESSDLTSSASASSSDLPTLGDDGVYHIENKQQHANFLAANSDKLIVMKVFAPWCRACKGLEPKYLAIVHSKVYENLPLVFCDLSIQHNKAFVKELGVLALPSIQFYVGESLVENFPCGPSKVPILKRKLAQLVNDNVDASTRQLKKDAIKVKAIPKAPVTANETMAEAASASTIDGQRQVFPSRPPPAAVSAMTEAEKRLLAKVPYFSELSLADLDQVLSKAKTLTFEAGSILMREGKRGRTFYVLQQGEVEICQQTFTYSDPLVGASVANAQYLGTVINRLDQPGDYFGERALITGEPRAASIRASSERVTCWAFDKDDFPASSVLSGRTRNMEELEMVNDKYGVQLSELHQREVMQQIMDASTASQVRGSVNNPQLIRGVDTDDEDVEEVEDTTVEEVVARPVSWGMPSLRMGNSEVVSLLTRFQMIRYVSRCFEYMVKTRAQFGDEGIRKRRSMLVSLLTPARRAEFLDTFALIDADNDGTVSLLELKRALESVGEVWTEDEYKELIGTSQDQSKGSSTLTETDFMGIMAEAEFYYLFRDMFAELDTNDTGFVRAKDLDRILCGVRDLISDDRYSIIDIEDDEMLVDYDQFSRMLLGTSLI